MLQDQQKAKLMALRRATRKDVARPTFGNVERSQLLRDMEAAAGGEMSDEDREDRKSVV